jgi:FAD/FMN-containing dehydrogenase
LHEYKDPVALGLMHGIKRLLDPNGILNPGKVL